ncbi:chloramphenicol phosphotransferase CPT family protein [Planococcus chinensis]|uniref:Chloramphenicol phosphotransferase CPT family protein n=1 Tax=Planococcus chinensis TaxID=272917 RepID=A0ABW4QLD8_9BACL
MEKGTIILLNGASSAGKSTLAREFVKHMPEFFALSIDDFDLVIEKMEDREQGHLIPVSTEHYFHRTIAMFSDSGVNLIADQIWHDVPTIKDCITVLQDYPVLFTGVHCPTDAIEQREKARGDRRVGQAKAQLGFVHQQQEIYDVEVDTHRDSIETCVQLIQAALLKQEETRGWAQTIESFQNSCASS